MSGPTSVELSRPVIDGELSSVNFFNGRLLVSGDLKAEQESRKVAIQRVGQVVGQGVVDGLRVSRMASEAAGTLALGIDAGTAVNRQGALLKLASPIRLEILAPVERVAANVARSRFEDCAPQLRRIRPPKNLLGFQVVVARPDTLEKGRAPLVAMDMSAAGCNIDRIAQAIRFDLVGLRLPIDLPSDSVALRNVAAFLLRTRQMDECADGVPLALLRFDEFGRLDFLDMWSVRRSVSRGLPTTFARPSHPAVVDGTAWSDVFALQTESVGEASILQFQDQLAQAMLEKLPLDGSGIESKKPLALQEVFPHLPPAGILPEKLDWFAFLGETEIGKSAPPVIEPDLADLLLREAASRPGSDAIPLNKSSSVKPLKVYRIAGTQKHLFVRTQDAKQWATETVFDQTRIGTAGMPAKSASGYASVQSALEDVYSKLQAKLPYRQSASEVTVAPHGTEIAVNVQNSLQNLSRTFHEGFDSLRSSEIVTYDGSSVDAPSGSVKTALDGLHQRLRSVSGLSHVLTPADWVKRIDSLPNTPTASARQDLNLFFETGNFPTDLPVVLSGFGHVRIQGAGAGTLLFSNASESALIVRDCLSCTVVDIGLRSNGTLDISEKPGLQEDPVNNGLRGALSIERVNLVHLERIHAASIGATLRKSSGISVHNEGLKGSSRVVVRDCSIEIGDGQVGLLVSNGTEILVSGCTLNAHGGSSAAGPRRRALAATMLARHFLDLATSPPPSDTVESAEVEISTGERDRISNTDRLVGSLGSLRDRIGNRAGFLDRTIPAPPIVRTPRAPAAGPEWLRWIPSNAWKWARSVADKDTDEDTIFRRFLAKFRDALGKEETIADPFLSKLRSMFLEGLHSGLGVASRGIVVAGQIPVTTRIEANRIDGAAIGILVGLSKSGTNQDRHSRILARSVRIAGNEVSLPDLRGRPGQSAGIQVGNVDDLSIVDNTVEVATQTWWNDSSEAIRIWGQFGRRISIRDNRASGDQSGIWIHPLTAHGSNPPTRRENPWTVSGNLCEEAKPPVNIVGGWSAMFRLEDNFS